ncbi:MAG: hypothetical protein ACI9PZ_003326 [Parvicella sp.]|jgi:hypothetical protein
MPRFTYTDAMVCWAKENVPGKRMSASLVEFNKEFDLNKTSGQWKAFTGSRNINNGMQKGRISGEVAKKYSAKMLKWLAVKYANRPVSAILQEFNHRFKMSVSQKALLGTCKREGIKSGRNGQFVRNQDSWNKGKKMPYNENSAKSQFKAGQVPHNTNYLGHERVSKDGYIEISVDETNPHTGYERRYVHKHRHEWQKANGDIPKGSVLKCMDGDKSNCDPSNWELIERALLPKLTRTRKFESQPNELKPTILAITTLQYKIEEAAA